MGLVPNNIYRTFRRSTVNISAYRYYILGSIAAAFILPIIPGTFVYRKKFINKHKAERKMLNEL